MKTGIKALMEGKDGLMRKLWQFGLMVFIVIFVAACGGTPTPPIPTPDPNNATVEPTVTANPDGVMEETAEAAADETAEATAEGTAQVLNTAFNFEVSGDTELTINSDDGAFVEDEMTGSPAQGESAPILNTPVAQLRYLRFMMADGAYILEISFSDNVTTGDYEIGVDNISTTVGDNINQDAGGSSQNQSAAGESTAEATDDSSGSVTPVNTPQATQATGSGGEAAGSSIDTGNPPSNVDQGIVERDEAINTIIAARLEPANGEGTSYNLLQGGTLTIGDISDNSVSGSIDFTLSPADDEARTVVVVGTFTDIPLTSSDEESLTPSP
jgi:hypothetical protein